MMRDEIFHLSGWLLLYAIFLRSQPCQSMVYGRMLDFDVSTQVIETYMDGMNYRPKQIFSTNGSKIIRRWYNHEE